MSPTGPRHGWQVAGQKEELLLERFPMLGSGRRAVKGSDAYEREQVEIDSYGVGDLYLQSFSTTSPPAEVRHEYLVTRKDGRGLWGVLLQGEVHEYSEEDME